MDTRNRSLTVVKGCLVMVMGVVIVGGVGACDWPEATAAPDSTGSSRTDILEGLDQLDIAAEHDSGYDRNAWSDWTDPDGNGCDTREEVLIAEDTSGTLTTANCGTKLHGGEWRSLYDNESVTDPSELDIDHFVPLAEAHASGGHTWDADRRADYATHLDDDDHLVAVTASTNRSKGDKDPAEWMPPHTDATCDYLATWVTIKHIWTLSVDQDEHTAITDLAATCP